MMKNEEMERLHIEPDETVAPALPAEPAAAELIEPLEDSSEPIREMVIAVIDSMLEPVKGAEPGVLIRRTKE
jgi:hypothetical protein